MMALIIWLIIEKHMESGMELRIPFDHRSLLIQSMHNCKRQGQAEYSWISSEERAMLSFGEIFLCNKDMMALNALVEWNMIHYNMLIS